MPDPKFRNTIVAVILSVTAGCMHRQVHSATATASDNSYMDLEPGGRLRVLVPLLKSGGFRPAVEPAQNQGNTLVFSAEDLIGYQVSYYAIERRRAGRVRLKFTSAQVTRDGKTVEESGAPVLPMALPGEAQYVRLIYLVRRSQSDHNMAITASKNRDLLNAFTATLKEKPDACQVHEKVFCTWVPAGVAVRPESLSREKGTWE